MNWARMNMFSPVVKGDSGKSRRLAGSGVNVTELCPANLTLRPGARTVEKKLKDPASEKDER